MGNSKGRKEGRLASVLFPTIGCDPVVILVALLKIVGWNWAFPEGEIVCRHGWEAVMLMAPSD
jgi:hypothetical protein